MLVGREDEAQEAGVRTPHAGTWAPGCPRVAGMRGIMSCVLLQRVGRVFGLPVEILCLIASVLLYASASSRALVFARRAPI